MLKKQTVWLLTMLSLMIVLSVYYMTQEPGDLAFMNKGNGDALTEETSKETTGEETDINVAPGGNELFAAMRMQVQDERSMKKDRLGEIVASSTASVEEKKQAYDQMDAIDQVGTKEMVLEERILAEAEYQDVLVRHDGTQVHVHVQVDELSKSEVVNIMQMVRDEFGDITVNVDLQPMTES
jgi:stage III sporulation protein AH